MLQLFCQDALLLPKLFSTKNFVIYGKVLMKLQIDFCLMTLAEQKYKTIKTLID